MKQISKSAKICFSSRMQRKEMICDFGEGVVPVYEWYDDRKVVAEEFVGLTLTEIHNKFNEIFRGCVKGFKGFKSV